MTNPNLESLRRAETDLLFAHLRPGMRVLELGGGNGLQARLLQERGCAVTSLDIPGREQPAVQHFPVQDYDGIHIPAANESFDAIFSASVLEHVRDLPALLAEARRVIAPGGFMLHLVPSPVWRFWTSAARYPFLVSDLFNPPCTRHTGPEEPAANRRELREVAGDRAASRGVCQRLRGALRFS